MPVIYRLDPRIKLLLVLQLTVLVFFIDKLIAAVCLMFFFVFFLLIIKLKDKTGGIKHIRNLSLLVLFVLLMQTLLVPGENYIVKPLFPPSFPVLGGFGSLKWEGFILGLVIICRLISLMILFFIFSKTTSPHQLALSFCSFGFNYRSAYVITTAFNLIPVFKEEASAIMDAQKLRGMCSFEKKSFFGRIKAGCNLAVPLVLGAMRKAQISSVAMDSRAFGVYSKRTWLDKPHMKLHDFFTIFVCLFFTVFLLYINYFSCYL